VVLFLLLCRKAERVADDMRALMTKMKAMQGQLNKVTTTDTLCLFRYFPVLKNILLAYTHPVFPCSPLVWLDYLKVSLENFWCVLEHTLDAIADNAAKYVFNI